MIIKVKKFSRKQLIKYDQEIPNTLQTKPQHLEKVTEHKQSKYIRKTKQSNQLSLPHQNDCKTRKGTKYCITKQGPIIEPPLTMGATINNESTIVPLP